jgi:hypothetical protein
MTIKKAVVGLSYDDEGSKAKVTEEIEKEAQKEKQKSPVTNHYFKRTSSEPFSLKFNYPVAGIPICAYSMANALHSEIEKCVFVGDELSKKVFDEFVEHFQVNKDYERFSFAHEGSNWSMPNTNLRGMRALGARKDKDLTLICAGDLVHGFKFDQMLQDDDLKDEDIVMRLNAMQNIYGERFAGDVCPYNRRFHLRINNGDLVKEQNWWLTTFDDNYLNAIELLFGARKTYGGGNNGEISGRQKFIQTNLLSANGIVAGISTAPTLVSTMLQMQKKNRFLKDLSKSTSTVSYKGLSKLFSGMLGCKTKISGEQGDWGFLADVDSYEDLCFHELLMSDGPSNIHPHYDELKEFTKILNKNVPELKQIPNYLNNWSQRFSLLQRKELYDSSGNFKCPKNAFENIDEKVSTIYDQRQMKN